MKSLSAGCTGFRDCELTLIVAEPAKRSSDIETGAGTHQSRTAASKGRAGSAGICLRAHFVDRDQSPSSWSVETRKTSQRKMTLAMLLEISETRFYAGLYNIMSYVFRLYICCS